MDTNSRAFVEGYAHGALYGVATARQAVGLLERAGLPAFNDQIDAFRCGSEDGARADMFRLSLIKSRAGGWPS